MLPLRGGFPKVQLFDDFTYEGKQTMRWITHEHVKVDRVACP